MELSVTIQITDANFIGVAASMLSAIFGAGCLVVNYLTYRRMK